MLIIRRSRFFEADNVSNDWLYLDTYAWLGIALNKQGQKEKAKEVFEEVLIIEPDFSWVKYSLLPGLDKSD